MADKAENVQEKPVKACTIVPCCVGSMDMSVAEAAKTLAEHQAKQLVILEQEMPIGVATLTDIVYKVVAKNKNAETTKIHDICTKEVFFVDESEPLAKAYMYMLSANHLFCPVVANKKFVGLLTLGEVLKQLRQ